MVHKKKSTRFYKNLRPNSELLNTILALGVRLLKQQIFKSSNSGGLPERGHVDVSN